MSIQQAIMDGGQKMKPHNEYWRSTSKQMDTQLLKRRMDNFLLHQKAGNCWVPLWQSETRAFAQAFFSSSLRSARGLRGKHVTKQSKTTASSRNGPKPDLGVVTVRQLGSQSSSRACTMRDGWNFTNSSKAEKALLFSSVWTVSLASVSAIYTLERAATHPIIANQYIGDTPTLLKR